MKFCTRCCSILIVFALIDWAGRNKLEADIFTFQQGLDGYVSVVDTYLQNNLGDASNSGVLVVRRGDGVFSTRNTLILFGDLFGRGNGQIAAGSTIESAQLLFNTNGDSDAGGEIVNIHRMLMPWDASDGNLDYGLPPWNNQSWIQADNFEASAVISDSIFPLTNNAQYQFDVTEDLQAWSNGTANFGWVLLADPETDDDDARFYSSDWSQSVEVRPRLVVNCSPAPVLGDVNRDGVVNLLDVTPFVDAVSTGTYIPEADINQDGEVNLLDVQPFVQLLIG